MHVAYGPPGIGGVKTLQYVSGVDGIPEAAFDLAELGGVVALALWLWGRETGNKELRRKAGTAAVVAGAVAVFRGLG